MLPKNCTRIDANRLQITGEIPATIFANERVPVENTAIDELAELLELQKTADAFYKIDPQYFSEPPRITQVSLSPDFHKGAGIPIGTTMVTRGMVIPQSVGNDINCGVRLHRTSLKKDQLLKSIDKLGKRLRQIFFEGGRNIPLTQRERIQLLSDGLGGFNEAQTSKEGIWAYYDRHQAAKDRQRTKHHGSRSTYGQIWGLDSYISREDVTHDSQIGSIGGGNHFVEIQVVDKIINGTTAHYWGLKPDQIVIMIHSGSVSLGHLCGEAYKDLVKSIYPKNLGYPRNGIFPLPDLHPSAENFWTALHNAANFAFMNRLCLSLMMRQALLEVVGDHSFELLYDTPHNLAWKQADNSYIHRKGASPAGGIGEGCDDYFGEVVLTPGSMGSSSYVMEGCGNPDALATASHGAGRCLSRGDTLKGHDEEFQKFLKEFTIITPIDPNRQDIRHRPEILEKYYENLRKEAPFAYKNVGPIVQTLQDANVAKPVAELKPLLTIKG
jgi:tRNA-splicing ligase RtcB